MPLVMTRRPSPVATRCRAPLATRVLPHEVEHATWSKAGLQLVAGVAGEARMVHGRGLTVVPVQSARLATAVPCRRP
jgi:hypothetical protein